jgi:PIN domain nuclease of toxin-antitoxin system
MKILIDTSYFLPFIKIAIENVSQDLMITLLSDSSHEYYYSELSIFELTAKGLKFSSQGDKITPQDIQIGIDAIENDARLTKVSYINNPFIIELSSHLKPIHNDTIDCLILATAICTCECIITMDVSFFEDIQKNNPIIKKINEINRNFKFWFNDLSNDYKSLDITDIEI